MTSRRFFVTKETLVPKVIRRGRMGSDDHEHLSPKEIGFEGLRGGGIQRQWSIGHGPVVVVVGF